MLGTASKLKDARTISLTGDVSGTANFDGSSNITIQTTGKFATLTGTIAGNNTESPSKTISYPAGFNKNNSVVITANLQRSNSKGYGAVYDSASYVGGAIPLRVALGDSNLTLTIKNIQLSESKTTISDISSSTTFSYFIVLMKI